MTALNEGVYAGEFLISELPGKISRDEATVTVPAATELVPGTVLGKLSATGKYVPYDDSASDGRETAAGILYAKVENTGGAPADKIGVVINFGAEVTEADLVFEEGVDEDGAIADLAALGIKAR